MLRSAAAASALPLRRLAASRPAPAALLLRGGDHGHGHGHHGADPVNPADYSSADFSTPFWRNMFIGSLGVFVAYHANQYYEATKDPEAIHPITAYISYQMTDDKEWKKINYAGIKDMEMGAADTLLMQELPGGRRVYRIVAPELLERGSPFGISAGTQADLSDIVIRN